MTGQEPAGRPSLRLTPIHIDVTDEELAAWLAAMENERRNATRLGLADSPYAMALDRVDAKLRALLHPDLRARL